VPLGIETAALTWGTPFASNVKLGVIPIYVLSISTVPEAGIDTATMPAEVPPPKYIMSYSHSMS